MSHKLGGRPLGANDLRLLSDSSTIVLCRPYIDTVVVFFHQLPKGMAKELRKVHGNRLRLEKVRYGKLVVLHQPTVETLRVAEKYRAMVDAQIYRVDLAYDLYCSDPHFSLANFIRRNVALKFGVKQPIHTIDDEGSSISNVDRLIGGPPGTMYWRLFSAKATVTNLVHYNDRPGKVDGGYPEHLELRIMPTRNCRAAGFVTLHDVIDANPLTVFERHVEIIRYDFEGTVFARIRRPLQQERKSHLSNSAQKRRSAFEEDFVDRYRANIKNFAIERFRRAEMQFAQTAKRLIPRAVKKMSRYPSSIFGIPQKLTWGAKSLGSLKYKKKIEYDEE